MIGLVFQCDGESGDPQLNVADDEEVYVKWGKYDFQAPFSSPVKHETATWTVGKLKKKGTCELTVNKKDGTAKYWTAPFGGGTKRKNVAPNWDNWLDEEEEEMHAAAAAAAAAAPPPAAPEEKEDPNGIPKRKKAGWKPTREDW